MDVVAVGRSIARIFSVASTPAFVNIDDTCHSLPGLPYHAFSTAAPGGICTASPSAHWSRSTAAGPAAPPTGTGTAGAATGIAEL